MTGLSKDRRELRKRISGSELYYKLLKMKQRAERKKQKRKNKEDGREEVRKRREKKRTGEQRMTTEYPNCRSHIHIV